MTDRFGIDTKEGWAPLPDIDLPEQFAGCIKEALRARKISQAEFAKMIGRSEKHVSQVLTGKAATTLNEWADWAAAIGLRFQIHMTEIVSGGSES